MDRRHFLGVTAAAGVRAGGAQPQTTRRPNLLLILTDQQSHTAWSGARNPWLSTPAMDSLASAGTVFEEAYCNYPVCSPSRASIFSSRLPHETGVMTNGQGILATIPTMGELFRGAGYRTAYAGKWHLPKSFDGMTAFDKIAGGSALGAAMDAPVAEACVSYLKHAGGSGEPFLLVASFMNPHDICDWIRQHPGARSHPKRFQYPPAPANQLVDPQEPEAIQFHRTAGYDLMSQAVGIASQWLRDDFRLYLNDYYRMVEAVDREIGRVLTALRANHLDGNTLVALTSDHGEGMGGHRWVQKASFYEEAVHVPFMLRVPGMVAARRSADLVTLMDIMPTFCDYAGTTAPAGMRGVSLRLSLEGKAQPREFVTSQLRYDSLAREGRMLRTERYKYVVYNCGQRAEQLFDLLTDPGEVRNLAHEAGAKPLLQQHRVLLQAELLRTQDAFRPAR
jgi:arylsulfatase A-like enzyme